MFADAGLPFTGEIERVPNSRKALRLAELARDRGVYERMHERLFAAYWAQGRDIGDDAVLLDEAERAGLDLDEAREVLASDRFGDRVLHETERAVEAGAGGVPAWLLDDRLLIPGAQPHALFAQVLGKLGYAEREGEPDR